MTEEQVLALEENIPRLDARRTRRELRFASDVKLTADQIYDLVLAETDSVEQAEEAWKRYRHAELRAGIVPE